MRIKLWFDVYVEKMEIDIDPGAIPVSVLHVTPSLIFPAPLLSAVQTHKCHKNNL